MKNESIRLDNTKSLVTTTRILCYESRNSGLLWGIEYLGNEESLRFYEVLLCIFRMFPQLWLFLSLIHHLNCLSIIQLTYYPSVKWQDFRDTPLTCVSWDFPKREAFILTSNTSYIVVLPFPFSSLVHHYFQLSGKWLSIMVFSVFERRSHIKV